MKINAISTMSLEEYPNLIWVQIETDEGYIGLGETYFGPEAVAAYIHETVAPYLLGKDPLKLDLHHQALDGVVGFNSISTEMRGNSAVDIALWDIFGQFSGQPLYQLLGGQTHEKIRVYNTCAGYGYNSTKASPDFNLHSGDNLQQVWSVSQDQDRPYEDIDAFMNRPGELAQSLLSQGITTMKIWPFDGFAEAYNGQWISPADLEKGANIFREIRETVGMNMEVALEMHMKWSLPAAKQIARTIDPFQPLWYEDPIKPDHMGALLNFKQSTPTPLAASELLATRRQFIPLLEQKIADFIIIDITWCGGLSEARKIAAMAEAYHIPVMAHDCTGPVALAVNSHFSMNAPNTMLAEFVRAYYTSWYPKLVTELPFIDSGWMYPLHKPGLGTALRPDFFRRDDLHMKRSARKVI